MRDKILSCIKRIIGSKNPTYPDDTFTQKQFERLADELMKMLENLPICTLESDCPSKKYGVE